MRDLLQHPNGAPAGLFFLHYSDPRYLEGLRRHGMLGPGPHGLRLHNTGLDPRPFGGKWHGSPELAAARASGLPYYMDRLSGGMPFQSLEGLPAIAADLAGDPHFMGFQVHELGNAPLADHRQIRSLITGRGLAVTEASFKPYLGRISRPYFGGGDHTIYAGLHRPLESLADIDAFLTGYMERMLALTRGRVMAVNGYIQLYHRALALGAANVMAEIGNQVPLTAFQIACARGAARAFGKPFGVYYEPWGGRPFGAACALGWSPWFKGSSLSKDQWSTIGFRFGDQLGSGQSLHLRLLLYAWLAGAGYIAEEWGTENTFGDWDEYPLTDYGRVTEAFVRTIAGRGRLRPLVPAAIVLPPGTGGIDIQFLAQRRGLLHGLVPADRPHELLARLTADLFGMRRTRYGPDDFNLTPSPWVNCLDVVPAEAPPERLGAYAVLVCLDARQARGLPVGRAPVMIYDGSFAAALRLRECFGECLPLKITGEVAAAQARADDGSLWLGVFNVLGVTKTAEGEQFDLTMARQARITGNLGGLDVFLGAGLIDERGPDSLALHLPPGSSFLARLPNALPGTSQPA